MLEKLKVHDLRKRIILLISLTAYNNYDIICLSCLKIFFLLNGGIFMALIRPCADLRNNYNEISKICHETNEPMYITKNGTNDLVILSDEAFEDIIRKNSKPKKKELIDLLLSISINIMLL